MGAWFEYQVAKPGLYMLLAGVFALAGLLIATAGVYDMVAFNVARRHARVLGPPAAGRRPAGYRAIGAGARSGDDWRGTFAWLGGAFGVTRLLSTLLYGDRPGDMPTFVAAGALLSVVAFLTCYLPGRRAAGLDPAVALRHE